MRIAHFFHRRNEPSARRWPALGRLLWALPCSALGALFGGLMLLGGGSLRRLEGTLEFALSPRFENSAFGRWLPFAAITFGQVILGVSRAELARVRAHERVHVRQYERLGVFFLIAYPLASILAWRRGLCPYRGNCFEIEAYAVDAGVADDGDDAVDGADAGDSVHRR